MTSLETMTRGTPVRSIAAAVDLHHATAFTIENASELARALGARLDLLHVTPPELYPAVEGNQAGQRAVVEEGVAGWCSRQLYALAKAHAHPAVETRVSVLQGRPAQAIADYAEEHGIDLIIVASEGRRGLRRLLFGSTAESLLRQTDIPTLVLTMPEAGGVSLRPHNRAAAG